MAALDTREALGVERVHPAGLGAETAQRRDQLREQHLVVVVEGWVPEVKGAAAAAAAETAVAAGAREVLAAAA